MSDGVLYKSNGSAWSKSVAKKSNGSVFSDGVVRHSNGSTWYDNYPMEQLYTQTFNVVWTQAYNGSGVMLDPATWGDHPRAGDTANFKGLFGFDNNAMKSFVSNGVIQELVFTCYFDDPGHSGNPVVNFCPHKYTSKPSSFSTSYVNTSYVTTSTFNQTGSNYARSITLPDSAWWGGAMGGVHIYAGATAANSCRFAGKTTSHSFNAYNSTLKITVLK